MHDEKKKKAPRVRKALSVTVGGAVPFVASVPAGSTALSESVPQQLVYAFYVNGTGIGGGDGTHSTPWGTIAEAKAAATVYAEQLNAWWAAMYPDDFYIDLAPTEDLIHLDGNDEQIRCGILPNIIDNPPPPSVGLPPVVTYQWGDGTAWQNPP